MREQVSLSMPPALLAEVDRRTTSTRSAWINQACEAFLRRDASPSDELLALARKVATCDAQNPAQWSEMRAAARHVLAQLPHRQQEW